MTHDDLVKLARKWLIRARRCDVVLTEKHAPYGESPDAIGWSGRTSILIECKTTLADFRRDKDKWFRSSAPGLGQQRFYMAPRGVIPVDELPEGWGLLELDGSVVRTIVTNNLNYYDESRAAAELPFLVSYLRQQQVLAALKRKPKRSKRRR